MVIKRNLIIIVISVIILYACEEKSIIKKDEIEYGELDTFYNRKPYKEYGKWGFVNSKNEVVIMARFDSVFNFNENRCPIIIDKKYGVIDSTGKMIIACKYDAISKFKDGFAIIAKKEWDDLERGHHWKYGIIKSDGELFTNINYEDPRFFREGLIAFRVEMENKRYYEDIELFEKYDLDKIVSRTQTHWGYMNNKGEIIIKPKNYYEIDWTKKKTNGYYFRNYNTLDMYFIKDWMKCLNSIVDGKTGQSEPVDDFREGYALITTFEACGWINKTGRFIIPLKYKNAKYFTEDLAAVELKGKWGYIDKKSRMIINNEFDDAEQFNEGIAGICKKGLWGYIDKEGKSITPIKYDEVKTFNNGKGEAKMGNLIITIDKNGKEIGTIEHIM